MSAWSPLCLEFNIRGTNIAVVHTRKSTANVTISVRIRNSVDFANGIWFADRAMSHVSNVLSAAVAVRHAGLVASWHPSSICVSPSMSSMPAPQAYCTTSWAFAGATKAGFAVANTKRSPRRLEESLT
jgi:hypothetical protein